MGTIVVTGASRGIGLELVKTYLAKGDKVIATYRSPEPPSSLTLLQESNQLILRPLEVTDSQSIQAFAASLEDTQIDVLVNNAGVIGPDHQSYSDMDVQGWEQTFEINTIAPLIITNALLSHLAKSRSPKVLTISSQMGALSRESTGMFAYRSSKAAVNKVMQVLALELKAEGIIVCPVHPGWVKTDMGGDEADITVQESAEGIVKLSQSLTMNDSGKFFTWEGHEHAW
ncbi:SDR family oxidoreductase [Grimontia kaedaensis]|uniref:SDR family oxidoreductase n=1 Tax=Grimontia kaedaensis TaxID=2872157 RepID=A0ABY4X1P1_9GAMM|nr:SDR family oxidoreductase [Grimontia kaedaensis]USH05178.1 SDR family oxidoreductase [Grimontia kaedaensis]